MKITPLEIRNHPLKKSIKGYDVREVEGLRETAATALEESAREANRLADRLRRTEAKLKEHMENEKVLKDAITSAQRMVDDLKANARREAELVVAEAKMQGEEIVRQAQRRAIEIQDEILRLKRQRIEMEAAIKAIIDYHSTKLLVEEVDSKKADAEAAKVKYIPSKP